MEVIEGKIIQITEEELYQLYIEREMYHIMTFREYKAGFEKAGTKIDE